MQMTILMISTTAARITRTPMTAPSAVLSILVVLSSCEVIDGEILSTVRVVMVGTVDGIDTLSVEVMVLVSLPLVAVVDECVSVTV